MQFSGVVQKGMGTGEVFGFPTANIPLTEESVSGVYAASVMVDGKKYAAAVYADQQRGLLESHLLDFSGDLYGKEILVTLGQKVREDDVFISEQELRDQIAKDVAAIRALAHTI